MATLSNEMPPLHAAEVLATSSAADVAGASGGLNAANVGGTNSSGSSDANTPTPNNGTTNTSLISASSGSASAAASATTISAAADSSDNQPGTPQPQPQSQQQQQHQQTLTSLVSGNDQQQQQSGITHQPYAAHANMYNNNTSGSGQLPTASSTQQMYGASGGGIYANASGQELQQQQQQHTGYASSYMNSYEQFYQQQQQQQSAGEYGNNQSSLYGGGGGSADYKPSSIRYHPYLQTPISGMPSSSGGNNNNINGNDDGRIGISAPSVTSVTTAGAVSTTSAMSPRVVSSTSPTSTSSHMQLGAGGNNHGTGRTTNSPGCKLQCKKCGIMTTNESELQEHIANVHGESPYGSSGYASSPYIKDELSAQQPPVTGGGNPGDILDLDSQKMVYPPLPGALQHIMQHDPTVNSVMPSGPDPLHSMQTMQQRALHSWEHQSQEGLPQYMQQNQQQHSVEKPGHQLPYYSPKQSSYQQSTAGMIKQEFGAMVKSEYPDSQHYVDKSFDPTAGSTDICQQTSAANGQQQQMMPVATSPAEFPSTTTGGPQENAQQQQYRGFEPPSSSSVLPANSLTAKAATWKSNEARRPKTYNCTACNKWFTSSGHLKRHYNTTLHKNAVKSSGQPDPASLPISAHHHPARDPVTKTPRRGSAASAAAAAAATAAAQQPPAPVQPPEPPRSPPEYGAHGAAGVGGPMSQYSASASPTSQNLGQQSQGNRLSGYGQTNAGYPSQYMQQQQVQSTTNASAQLTSNNQQQPQTVLNGHPNGLAGPSAPITTQMPSSQMRGLLKSTLSTATTVSNQSESQEDSSCSSNNNSLNTTPQSPTAMLEMAEDEEEMEQQAPLLPQSATVLEEATLQIHQMQHPDYLNLVRHYHTHSNNMLRPQSPLIISHQQYQDQIQQQLQPPMGFSPTPPLQQLVHMGMPHNIMDLQQPLPYNIIPLDINTQQQLNNNMQLLQLQQQHITNTNSMDTINMDTMQPPLASHHHIHQVGTQEQVQTDLVTLSESVEHQLLEHHHPTVLAPMGSPAQQQLLPLPHMSHSTLLSNTSTRTTTTPPQQLQPPHITTTVQQLPPLRLQQQRHTTNTIPSFQQLQQASGLVPLESTMSYHTITGNSKSRSNLGSSHEIVQMANVDQYGNLHTSQQLITTSDGQVLQIIPSSSSLFPQSMYTSLTPMPSASAAPLSPYTSSQRSPQEGDLPPMQTLTTLHSHPETTQTNLNTLQSLPCSPENSNSSSQEDFAQYQTTFDAMSAASHKNNKNLAMAQLCAIKIEAIDESQDIGMTAVAINLGTDSKKSAEQFDGRAITELKAPKKPGRRPAAASATAKRQRTQSSASRSDGTPSPVNASTDPIRCNECDKEFTKNCYLTQHNKSFHSGEYPFRCQKCGKRFQIEEVYLKHAERHKTQDKPHKCDQCPKQFHHKTDLRRHIEAIHTGIKQHMCDKCDKGFCRKDHLRKHIETHNRPKKVKANHK